LLVGLSANSSQPMFTKSGGKVTHGPWKISMVIYNHVTLDSALQLGGAPSYTTWEDMSPACV